MECVLIAERDTEIDSGEQFRVGGGPCDRIVGCVHAGTCNMRRPTAYIYIYTALGSAQLGGMTQAH